jgi:prepilin peptidase CpaA
MLGAGDVKLYAALGALLGWRLLLSVLTASILVGGVGALFALLLRKNAKSRFAALYRYLWLLALTRKLTAYEVIDPEKDAYFSFGFCITLGTLIVLALSLAGVIR